MADDHEGTGFCLCFCFLSNIALYNLYDGSYYQESKWLVTFINYVRVRLRRLICFGYFVKHLQVTMKYH